MFLVRFFLDKTNVALDQKRFYLGGHLHWIQAKNYLRLKIWYSAVQYKLGIMTIIELTLNV